MEMKRLVGKRVEEVCVNFDYKSSCKAEEAFVRTKCTSPGSWRHHRCHSLPLLSWAQVTNVELLIIRVPSGQGAQGGTVEVYSRQVPLPPPISSLRSPTLALNHLQIPAIITTRIPLSHIVVLTIAVMPMIGWISTRSVQISPLSKNNTSHPILLLLLLQWNI